MKLSDMGRVVIIDDVDWENMLNHAGKEFISDIRVEQKITWTF